MKTREETLIEELDLKPIKVKLTYPTDRPGVPDVVKVNQVGATAGGSRLRSFPARDQVPAFKKVEGTDNDFVALDLTSETAALLENLPAKATIHFQVTAYNAAGGSARSEVVSVTLT